jgi:DNA polymerase-4
MQRLGIQTGADLRTKSLAFLQQHFGKSAAWYLGIANGQDDRPVVADRPRKSSGSETTFKRDLIASAEIEAGVEAMADDVWAWCDKAKAFGRTVTVKVKFADFRQVTRSRSFSTVIARQDLLRQASVELVRTLLPTARGVRLLGVTVSNFDSAPAEADDELPLFGSGGVIVPRPDTAPRVAATGSR